MLFSTHLASTDFRRFISRTKIYYTYDFQDADCTPSTCPIFSVVVVLQIFIEGSRSTNNRLKFGFW